MKFHQENNQALENDWRNQQIEHRRELTKRLKNCIVWHMGPFFQFQIVGNFWSHKAVLR